MNTKPYIAIEGPIGVGKTTLARILGETLPAEVLLEVFEQNPFLSDFYADRARYAFQTQIFFLLSRYHQQHNVIADTIRHSTLVSDYLFAKDWLFAHLNLQGDELIMYERVHAILGEQIPEASLVVYLRASTDTLLRRIAFRDRPYEREMDGDYIHSLRMAYEDYFAGFTRAPVLMIDTENLDIVHDPEARAIIVTQVKSALQASSRQPLLWEESTAEPYSALAESTVAHAHRQRGRDSASALPRHSAGIFFDYLTLSAEIGDLGRVLTTAWQEEDRQLAEAGNRLEARERALAASTPDLTERLVDAMKQLFRLADAAGIDLEPAILHSIRND